MKKSNRVISFFTTIALIVAMVPATSLSIPLSAGLTAIVLTGHNLTYSSLTYLDPNFEVVYGGTITEGKIYIDQGFSAASNDTLSCTNTGSITGSYNSSSGILAFSGSSTAADYQAFIRNVKFSTTSTNGTRTVVVTLTTNSGSIVYFSGTGHYYEYVATSGLTWTQARDAAAARTYQGQTGYLATVASAEENAFVAAKCDGNGWMGASDDGHDKQWYWVTGPEAGTKFCQQNAYTSVFAGVGVEYTVSGWYQNFASGEPNDWKSGGNGTADGENYLHMYSNDGTWNDYSEGNTGTEGYLVEYGTTVLSAAGSVVSLTVTITDDGTAPTITSVTPSTTTWTDQDVTVTINATDALSGIAAYSFNGGADWQAGSTKTYSENTTITAGSIKVKDNAGNIATYNTAVTIDYIDRIIPVLQNISSVKLVNVTSMKAASTKNGTLYLVPKGVYTTYQQILTASAKGAAVSCVAGVQTEIITQSILSGDYLLYAVDVLNHLSLPVEIMITYPLITTDAGATKTVTSSTATSSVAASSAYSAPAAASSATSSSQTITYKQTNDANKVSVEGLEKSVKVAESSDPEVSKIAVELVVESVKETTKPNFVIVAENTLAQGEQDILSVFDISLLKTIFKGSASNSKKVENSEITGMITVRLPLEAGLENRIGLSVVYINDEGVVTKLTSKLVEIAGKKYLEFQTDHFSAYAIVANQGVVSPNTGNANNPMTGMLFTLLLTAAAIFCLRKSEQNAL